MSTTDSMTPNNHRRRTTRSKKRSPLEEINQDEDDRRVRTPYFPVYEELRRVLPIWKGRTKTAITHLESLLVSLRGTRSNPVDWTEPDKWIPLRLSGDDRALAEAIWEKTKKTVNPRYVYGHWLTAWNYHLLLIGADSRISLSPRGEDFVSNPGGQAEAYIDEREGLIKILALIAEQGPVRTKKLLVGWSGYLKRRSRWGSPSSIRDTLSRRAKNLAERELVSRSGGQYT